MTCKYITEDQFNVGEKVDIIVHCYNLQGEICGAWIGNQLVFHRLIGVPPLPIRRIISLGCMIYCLIVWNVLFCLFLAADDVASSDESDENFTDVHKRKRGGVRRKWSEEENQMLRKSFSAFFSIKKPLDNESIRQAQAKYPPLRMRTIPQIKTRAWYCMKNGR